MADEISPTIEEAKPEVKPEVEEQMTEEAQLLETLRAASISKPEQLDGTIRNANKTFDMQSQRDQLANELNALREEVAKTSHPPAQEVYEDGQPVDLEGAMERMMDRRDKKKADAQAEIQGRQMQAWNTIQNDADFKLVEPIWNEKLKDPNFVYGVQSGQVDPVLEYHGIKSEYFKGLMQKAAGTIETLQGGGGPKVHIESGDARTPAMETDSDESESDKIIKEIGDRANSGKILSEDDELNLIRASLSK